MWYFQQYIAVFHPFHIWQRLPTHAKQKMGNRCIAVFCSLCPVYPLLSCLFISVLEFHMKIEENFIQRQKIEILGELERDDFACLEALLDTDDYTCLVRGRNTPFFAPIHATAVNAVPCWRRVTKLVWFQKIFIICARTC